MGWGASARALEPGVTDYVDVIDGSLGEPTTTAWVADTCELKLMNERVDP